MKLKLSLKHALLALSSIVFAYAAQAAGPDIQHWEAETGSRVHLVESPTLPMVDIRIDFGAGSAYDPEDKAGLASLTRRLLDTGADGLDEQAIAERIADAGARISGGTENDRAHLSIRALSSEDELQAAVDIAARLLARPDFPEQASARERQRSISGLRDALTRPATIASRAYSARVFENHPYGRNTTVASLETIERDDLQDFHAKYYTARNASIAIVGDVSRAQAEAIAKQLTEELAEGDAAPKPDEPAMPAHSKEHIPHPSSQAHVAAGMPGIARDDPDYFALLVGNHTLGGGGFVSRLMREVRDRQGLAYSVHSYFHPHHVKGPFRISLQTRGSQADKAVDTVEKVLVEFVSDGPTEDELEAAKDNIINGFGLRLDSNSKLLDHVAMIGFYQLPLDWLETYTEHVADVTTDDIRDAYSRRIRPDNLVVVIVGGDSDHTAVEAE